MSMLIMCAKGCGEAIEVGDEQIDEAKSHGAAINVSHEVCPTEEGAPTRTFKVVTIVTEFVEQEDHEEGGYWDKITQIGETVEATSYKQALPAIQKELNAQWGRVVGLADIVDADPDKSS